MANWKLTPFPIGESAIGITPEWTSGSGCYRVKRFSSKFPFFLHGSAEVVESSIQLIRWSSKEDAEQDVTVLINFSGEMIKLFSAQSFLVEFFHRLWSRTNISERLIYIKTRDLDKFDYKKETSIGDQVSIVNMFAASASRMSAKARQLSEINVLVFFDNCKKQRKE